MGRSTSNGSICFQLRSRKSRGSQTACCTDKKEIMAFNQIETVWKAAAENTYHCLTNKKIVATFQRNKESVENYLAHLEEATGYCELGNWKAIVDPEASMAQFPIIAG